MMDSHPISSLVREEGKIIYFQLHAEIFQRRTKIGPPWITYLSWINHRARRQHPTWVMCQPFVLKNNS